MNPDRENCQLISRLYYRAALISCSSSHYEPPLILLRETVASARTRCNRYPPIAYKTPFDKYTILSLFVILKLN